jgi:hypothetical protein
MGTVDIISLVLMMVIFAIWCWSMFRALWHLNRQARQRRQSTGGGYFTGVGHSLGEFARFLTAERYRADRRRLLIQTPLLFAVILWVSYALPRY